MTVWIIPANDDYYDHEASFQCNNFIDWEQNVKGLKVGDTVLIYCTKGKGIGEIRYQTRVEKTDMSAEEKIDDSQFWKTKRPPKDSYVRLRLVRKTSGLDLTMENMKANGMKMGETLQSPKRLVALGVSDFVLSRLSSSDPTDDEEHEMDGYPEGSKQRITVNKYERDKRNRDACIDHYGYRCQVCNRSMEELYGPIGKGFIHVHHLTPVSQMGEGYVVDPIRDLRPVCPNCHAMIHHTQLSIEELRELIKQPS